MLEKKKHTLTGTLLELASLEKEADAIAESGGGSLVVTVGREEGPLEATLREHAMEHIRTLRDMGVNRSFLDGMRSTLA